jgi:predicted patatin/cPLA2 family phospholipase
MVNKSQRKIIKEETHTDIFVMKPYKILQIKISDQNFFKLKYNY